MSSPAKLEAAQLRCQPQILMLATRQISFLLQAGVPLIRALDVVQGNPDPALQQCFEEIALQLNAGQRLSSAMARYPLVFPRVYIAMVRIGESTGALVACLELLSHWLERENELRGKVVRALTYPAFVLALTLGLALLVAWQVIPPFMEMFRQSAIPLPLPTKLLMWITDAVRSPIVWLVSGLVLGNYALLIRRRWHTEDGACEIYRRLESLPVMGWMLTCAGITRWCSSLDALLTSGVDLQTSLKLAGQAAGNPRLARDSRLAAKSVEYGTYLSEYLEKQSLYPPCVVHLVRAGEEVSKMPAMLRRAAEIYRQELEFQVDFLGATLEPILLSIVAAIVAFVLIAIFIPMYSFVDILGG